MQNNRLKSLLLLALSGLLYGCSGSEERAISLADGSHLKVFYLKYNREKGLSLDVFLRSRNPEMNPIKQSVIELLSGCSEADKKLGCSSEIPVGTKVLSFDEKDDKYSLDLSQQFISGGGTMSMKTRITQLLKTIEENNPNKPVYLYIEKEELKNIGGEGMIVDNPVVVPKESD